jgi:hypothetical protein
MTLMTPSGTGKGVGTGVGLGVAVAVAVGEGDGVAEDGTDVPAASIVGAVVATAAGVSVGGFAGWELPPHAGNKLLTATTTHRQINTLFISPRGLSRSISSRHLARALYHSHHGNTTTVARVQARPVPLTSLVLPDPVTDEVMPVSVRTLTTHCARQSKPEEQKKPRTTGPGLQEKRGKRGGLCYPTH